MDKPQCIKGGLHADARGQMRFCNDFDMGEVVRFYKISPEPETPPRAWQGHKQEKKWFFCEQGAFLVYLVPLTTKSSISSTEKPDAYFLEADKPMVLAVPSGYVTGFKALTSVASLTVYSNFNTEQSKADDYRFPLDNWQVDWALKPKTE
jgi:dTDP-4-dehydrorhamnose 3,5-epimerase